MHNTTATATTMTAPGTDLADLAESWLRRLRARRLSPRTIAAYQAGVEQFIRWHRKQGDGPVLLDKATASGFLADLLDDGARPATARLRQTALRRFSAWLSEEGEAEADLLHDMKPVTLDKPVVPRLDDGEMARMVAACKGRTFLDVRDMALLRLMTEGLLRASEALSLRVEDVDLTRGIALVRRGKGGRGRLVPFDDETSAALDRYIRARRKHPLAFKPDLWLPASGQTFSYPGLASAKPSRPRSPDGSGRS